jgi:predicted transcriptional regulator
MLCFEGCGSVVKYRDRVDIIVDVLNAASSGAKKTRIMHLANLSYSLLKKYLEEAAVIGFLSFDGGDYEVTERGQMFLKKYREYRNRFSKTEKEIQNMKRDREALRKMCRVPHEELVVESTS